MGRQYLNVLYAPTVAYKGHTEGLCGFMDNNATNDFMGPDGEAYEEAVQFAESCTNDKFKSTIVCHMNDSVVLNYEVIRNEACCLLEKHGSVVSPNWLTWTRNILTQKRAANRLINQNNNKIWKTSLE